VEVEDETAVAVGRITSGPGPGLLVGTAVVTVGVAVVSVGRVVFTALVDPLLHARTSMVMVAVINHGRSRRRACADNVTGRDSQLIVRLRVRPV